MKKKQSTRKLSDRIIASCRRIYADQFTGEAPELLRIAEEVKALEPIEGFDDRHAFYGLASPAGHLIPNIYGVFTVGSPEEQFFKKYAAEHACTIVRLYVVMKRD